MENNTTVTGEVTDITQKYELPKVPCFDIGIFPSGIELFACTDDEKELIGPLCTPHKKFDNDRLLESVIEAFKKSFVFRSEGERNGKIT